MPIDTIQAKTTLSPSQKSARDRAVAMFEKNATVVQSQETPVLNPSRISPEEIPAITSSTPAPAEVVMSQKDTSETPPSTEGDGSEATKSREEPLSSQYAQLARKEKAIRAKVLEVKAQEAAIKAREDAIAAKETANPNASIDTLRADVAKDPIGVLNKLGLTYEQLTNLLLNPNQPKPEELKQAQEMEGLRAEIKALKDAQDNSKKSFEDQQQQSYKQAINQIRNEAKQLISTDASYETIKETSSVDDVVELIEQTFKQDGVLLTVEEAAKAVEDHLVEEAMKIAKIKKIQQRLQPTTPVAKQEPVKQQQNTMKTLTNTTASAKPLSIRDRAIMAFKNEKVS